jgi:hypothetical protein
MTSSKGVFIQLDKENLSELGTIPCNANLNQLAQLINDAIVDLREKVDYNSSVNDSIKLMLADLQAKYLLLQSQINNLNVANSYIDLDLGCLSVPCDNTPLSLLTILQVFKNEICQLKNK